MPKAKKMKTFKLEPQIRISWLPARSGNWHQRRKWSGQTCLLMCTSQTFSIWGVINWSKKTYSGSSANNTTKVENTSIGNTIKMINSGFEMCCKCFIHLGFIYPKLDILNLHNWSELWILIYRWPSKVNLKIPN